MATPPKPPDQKTLTLTLPMGIEVHLVFVEFDGLNDPPVATPGVTVRVYNDPAPTAKGFSQNWRSNIAGCGGDPNALC